MVRLGVRVRGRDTILNRKVTLAYGVRLELHIANAILRTIVEVYTTTDVALT